MIIIGWVVTMVVAGRKGKGEEIRDDTSHSERRACDNKVGQITLRVVRQLKGSSDAIIDVSREGGVDRDVRSKEAVQDKSAEAHHVVDLEAGVVNEVLELVEEGILIGAGGGRRAHTIETRDVPFEKVRERVDSGKASGGQDKRAGRQVREADIKVGKVVVVRGSSFLVGPLGVWEAEWSAPAARARARHPGQTKRRSRAARRGRARGGEQVVARSGSILLRPGVRRRHPAPQVAALRLSARTPSCL